MAHSNVCENFARLEDQRYDFITISVLTCLETQRFRDSASDLSQMTQDVATLFDDCRIETSRQGVNHLVSVDFSVNSSCISGFLWTGCT